MKKLLVVVDYQKDFVDGSLGFAGAKALEAPIAARIREYRERGDDVIFTLDTHGADYAETREGKALPIAHCQKGSEGWRLFGEIEALSEGLPRFEKETFGCSWLFHHLEGNGYASIELCGLVSSICVLSNAVLALAAQPNTPVIVDARLTAAADPQMHAKALDILQNLQVQVVGR